MICYFLSCKIENAAAAAKSLQWCPTLCDPIDGSPPGSPVPGILQARLPFPSPMHESEKWKWSRSVVSNSERPHGLQPTRLLRPWDFLGKSTGVGCHCLLWYNPEILLNHHPGVCYFSPWFWLDTFIIFLSKAHERYSFLRLWMSEMSLFSSSTLLIIYLGVCENFEGIAQMSDTQITELPYVTF